MLAKVKDFYPRSPCGERPKPCTRLSGRNTISIHALLAESDVWGIRFFPDLFAISIHALLAESDCSQRQGDCLQTAFLSTLSLRRATVYRAAVKFGNLDFYPRSPCGERLLFSWFLQPFSYFYPRSPCGERRGLSLHWRAQGHFYPRSPCGERLGCFDVVHLAAQFLSTLSLRRATQRFGKRLRMPKFLSTLSLRRATLSSRRSKNLLTNFYPRSPCGERRPAQHQAPRKSWISIHALLAESDGTKKFKMPVPAYFYPRSPCGERRTF